MEMLARDAWSVVREGKAKSEIRKPRGVAELAAQS